MSTFTRHAPHSTNRPRRWAGRVERGTWQRCIAAGSTTPSSAAANAAGVSRKLGPPAPAGSSTGFARAKILSIFPPFAALKRHTAIPHIFAACLNALSAYRARCSTSTSASGMYLLSFYLLSTCLYSVRHFAFCAPSSRRAYLAIMPLRCTLRMRACRQCLTLSLSWLFCRWRRCCSNIHGLMGRQVVCLFI